MSSHPSLPVLTSEGPGHESPCDGLRELDRYTRGMQSWLDRYIARLDERVGMILGAAGEAAEHSKIASSEARKTRLEAEKIAMRAYAPVDELLKKYNDSNPPLMDAIDDDGLSENSRLDIQQPTRALYRIRRAEKRANLATVGAAILGLVYGAIKMAEMLHWIR